MESGADKCYPDSYQFLLDYTNGERLLLRSFDVIFTLIQRRLHPAGFSFSFGKRS